MLIAQSFAIKDILYKPLSKDSDYVSRRVLYKVTDGYPASLDTSDTNDSKNIFLYNTHFRVIFGADHNDSDTNLLAQSILDISQNVWQKEITQDGFQEPKNSLEKYIDIYIADTDAYNEAEDRYVGIDVNYAGYTCNYSDGTSYMVINPKLSDELLKVTIAHEFFHTVQYGYGLYDVSDDIWYKNIWFLEASAVMMEDEVYDDINDYYSYIDDYFSHVNYDLEYYDGSIEYGKVVFAKFLREKYGLDIIKNIFGLYNINETILDSIKYRLNDINQNINDTLLTYGKWVINKDSYFEEGVNYPDVKENSLQDGVVIYKYGLEFINSDSNSSRYLFSSNPSYLQSSYDSKSNILANVNDIGLIVANVSQDSVENQLLQNNDFFDYRLKKGWNLCGNIFDSDISLQDILSDSQVAWVYRDGKYEAYSNDEQIQQKIEDMGYKMEDTYISKGEGFWIYTDSDKNLTVSQNFLSNGDIDSLKGWHMVTFASSFKPSYIANSDIIWRYDQGIWSYYSSKYDLNITKIDKILPDRGYFILFDN